jgi:methanethiol S-methyltransferase
MTSIAHAHPATPATATAQPSISPKWDSVAARSFGIALGIGTQLLFLYTVVFLFLFLRYGNSTTHPSWWLTDALMAIGFALPHSILLAPFSQRWMRQHVPSGMLGSIHCCVTCMTLLTMFHFWGASDILIWRATGWLETAILFGFYGSWLALFYSLYCTGLGYQTGLTQWWYWFRQTKPPQRPFLTTGAFRWMRHPVYMSFLGLIWFTPTMSLDHAILTFVWTIYIYAGSYFKDKRLTFYIGQPYLEYGRRTTGLPLIGFGSLRRFQ